MSPKVAGKVLEVGTLQDSSGTSFDGVMLEMTRDDTRLLALRLGKHVFVLPSAGSLVDDEHLDRLRVIVDESFGMQPVLEAEALLDILERELGALHRRRWFLADAVHDLHKLVPPDRLSAAKETTLETIASLVGAPNPRGDSDVR
jgi:hypothetical protein